MTLEQCFQIEQSLARVEEALDQAGVSRGNRLFDFVHAALSAAAVERVRLELKLNNREEFADAFQRAARPVDGKNPSVRYGKLPRGDGI